MPNGIARTRLLAPNDTKHGGLTLDLANLRVKLDRTETTITIPAQPWETANEDHVQNERSAPAGAADLSQYAGQYGDRTLTFEDGHLFIRRPGGPRLKLSRTSNADEFSLIDAPQARFIFDRDATGKIVSVRVLGPQGVWETSERK